MHTCRAFLAAVFSVSAPALAQTTLPVSSADWVVQGEQPTGTFGRHVAPAGDVNGDGFADVLIGDASYDGALIDSGRILLFPGSTSGLSQTPVWALEGSAAGAGLSKAFSAGDVNGDGFDDIVVQTAQALSLYLGSSAGPILAPSWAASGSSTGHGDVNGDGFEDLAVFSYPDFSIFHGSSAGLESAPSTVLPLPPALFPGKFVSGPILDDFNNDGRDDLAYTWRYCGGKHCLFLVAQLRTYMGSDKGLSTQAKRTIEFDRERVPFVVSAGDANGDGYPDAAINDYADLAGGHGPPVTYLLQGGGAGLPTQLGGPAFEGFVGEREFGSGDGAGDVNGDGFADYLLLLDAPTPGPGYGPSVLMFPGSRQGYAQDPLLTVEPEQAYLGGSGAGDVNGDGLDDLIINAPGFSSAGLSVGRVYVFHGRTTF